MKTNPASVTQELMTRLGDSYCKYFKLARERISNLQIQSYAQQAFRRINSLIQNARLSRFDYILNAFSVWSQ